jgi:hypothetical protein
LKDAVQTYNGKNWDAISTLFPGRTRTQCCSRWHTVLDPIIDRTPGSKRKWTPEEDAKLKDAVQTYNGKNWDAISTLVSGRTKLQCYSRWNAVLDPSVERTTVRIRNWTPDESVTIS